MKGRVSLFVLLVGALLISSGTVLFAEPEPPVGAPSRPAINSLVHPFPIGPVDMLERSRPVSGTITMFARPQREVTIASAEFFVDGKTIGKTNEQPYKLEYDTSALTNGEHLVKAVGYDAQSKEIWSASAKATIGAPTGAGSPRPGATMPPPAGGQPGGPGIAPVQPASGSRPGNDVSRPDGNTEQLNAPSPREATKTPPSNIAVESAGMRLTRTYSHSTLSFSISYPQAWIASDKTEEMKPKQKGNAWIMFGADPVDKASVVVNLKRTQMEPGSSVDTFAKYNSYVKTWKRTALLGSSAFVTTDGKPENKRVIHRAIIIKDGCAWMLNCIDTTGKPAAESKKLFDSMIDTLSTLKPAQPVVTITEMTNID